MPAEIKFGTDGWRALIAEDYTYENVARCARGLCDYMKRRGTAGRGLIVGYDTRFLSPLPLLGLPPGRGYGRCWPTRARRRRS